MTPKLNCQYNKQRGNILVSSIMVLVVMNLLGVGLVNTSFKEQTVASYKIIDSEVHHLTDTCTNDVIVYFEALTGTPSTIPEFSQTDLDYMNSGYETTEMLNKLTGYSYNCNANFIISKTVSSSQSATTTGSEIGNSGGEYSSSGGNALKDYYQIVATGSGPKSSSKTINTIISVEY